MQLGAAGALGLCRVSLNCAWKQAAGDVPGLVLFGAEIPTWGYSLEAHSMVEITLFWGLAAPQSPCGAVLNTCHLQGADLGSWKSVSAGSIELS